MSGEMGRCEIWKFEFLELARKKIATGVWGFV